MSICVADVATEELVSSRHRSGLLPKLLVGTVALGLATFAVSFVVPLVGLFVFVAQFFAH
jgi:hypothetical protein